MCCEKGGIIMEKVFQDTFKENIIIDSNETIELNIAQRSKGSVFVEIKNVDDVTLNVVVSDNANFKIFVINRSNIDTCFSMNIELEQDAYCQMGFLDLENAAFHWKQNVNLNKQGANFQILSGQLCMPNVKKVNAMEVLHKEGHTVGEMRNFAVLSNNGKYEMVANGNIEKGCAEAQSHQATRVLTLGQGHTAKVIPLLLIDENDVKASHALTIGQPDEEQLYYLQSRGLSTSQAMGLLSVGYFLPVINLIDDEKLHEQVREEMESKVGLYGSK